MAKFKPGESGNPSGRPTGTPTKVSKFRALLEPHAQPLIEKCVALAKDGDTTALRLCLERIIPPMKSHRDPVRLESVGTTLIDHGRSVINAMLSGGISPDDGGTLMQAISAQARVVQVEDLADRVDALERALSQREKS